MGKKHMLKKEYHEALKHYNNALIHNPMHVKSLCNIGKVYREQGQGDKATMCYIKALTINPSDPVALFNLANVRRTTCDYERAIEMYEKVIQSSQQKLPANLRYDSLVNQGICFSKLDRNDEAIARCNLAIEINSEDESAYFNKLMFLLKKIYASARSRFVNVTEELCK